MRKQFGVLMIQPFPRTLPKKIQEDIHEAFMLTMNLVPQTNYDINGRRVWSKLNSTIGDGFGIDFW